MGVKDQKRTAKFAIAYCRVLWQCSEFLKTGEFKCAIDEGELKDFLLMLKAGWSDKYIPEATELFVKLQADVTKHWKTAPKIKPDINWIEEFIYEAYSNNL